MEKFMLIFGGDLCCAHIGRDGEVKDIRPMIVKWINIEEVKISWPNGIYKDPILAKIVGLRMVINNQFVLSVDVTGVEFVVDINGEPTDFKFVLPRKIFIPGERIVNILAKKYPVAAEAVKQWEEKRENREFNRDVFWADMIEKRRLDDAEKREQKNSYNKALDCFMRRELKNNERQIMEIFMATEGLKKSNKAHYIVGVQKMRGMSLFKELQKRGFMQ